MAATKIKSECILEIDDKPIAVHHWSFKQELIGEEYVDPEGYRDVKPRGKTIRATAWFMDRETGKPRSVCIAIRMEKSP